MSSTIKRFPIRADGRWHAISLNGAILHVGMSVARIVDLYALCHGGAKKGEAPTFIPYRYQFRAFATDEAIPPDAVHHVGSVAVPGGNLAYHVFRRD